MLDDENVLRQRDPDGALAVAAEQYAQVEYQPEILHGDHDDRAITSVVVAGMGGSALAALMAQAWLRDDITVPFEVVRDYHLPAHINENTLVIASSYSGNTEETVAALEEARVRGAQVAIIAAGGELIDSANQDDIAAVQLPSGFQPRMAVLYNLKALTALLAHFGLIDHSRLNDITALSPWLGQQTSQWIASVSTAQNMAKQLALLAVGKTPVVYGGPLTASAAYKWKISWNENAKNVAFWNQYPEFNHNEFIGWTSHPVEKPFIIFDLVSKFEHSQVRKRFEVSDRLLSGKRPKAQVVTLEGDSVLAELLWASLLADFVSIYVAILNGVNPVPVPLIERLKTELSWR